jgi:hypothetical protein
MGNDSSKSGSGNKSVNSNLTQQEKLHIYWKNHPVVMNSLPCLSPANKQKKKMKIKNNK